MKCFNLKNKDDYNEVYNNVDGILNEYIKDGIIYDKNSYIELFNNIPIEYMIYYLYVNDYKINHYTNKLNELIKYYPGKKYSIKYYKNMIITLKKKSVYLLGYLNTAFYIITKLWYLSHAEKYAPYYRWLYFSPSSIKDIYNYYIDTDLVNHYNNVKKFFSLLLYNNLDYDVILLFELLFDYKYDHKEIKYKLLHENFYSYIKDIIIDINEDIEDILFNIVNEYRKIYNYKYDIFDVDDYFDLYFYIYDSLNIIDDLNKDVYYDIYNNLMTFKYLFYDIDNKPDPEWIKNLIYFFYNYIEDEQYRLFEYISYEDLIYHFEYYDKIPEITNFIKHIDSFFYSFYTYIISSVHDYINEYEVVSSFLYIIGYLNYKTIIFNVLYVHGNKRDVISYKDVYNVLMIYEQLYKNPNNININDYNKYIMLFNLFIGLEHNYGNLISDHYNLSFLLDYMLVYYLNDIYFYNKKYDFGIKTDLYKIVLYNFTYMDEPIIDNESLECLSNSEFAKYIKLI